MSVSINFNHKKIGSLAWTVGFNLASGVVTFLCLAFLAGFAAYRFIPVFLERIGQ